MQALDTQKKELEAILLHHFGMNYLRPGQLEAASATLRGQDSLVILPTGGKP